MSKIIIGIHGLGSKPPKEILEKWWKDSIAEGLKNNNYHDTHFDFELAYWADVLHAEEINTDKSIYQNELSLSEPYLPFANDSAHNKLSFRKQALEYIEKYSDKIIASGMLSINIPSLTGMFIHRHFNDLEIYYSLSYINYKGKKRLARDVIIERLTELLKKHKNKEILLAAHSMGSIIAYDALIDYVPDVKINTLATMGSPLAQKYVMQKINSEKNFDADSKPPVPENICSRWVNLYDAEDVVAINNNLSDYFIPNSNGLQIEDMEVENNYFYKGKNNPHKSYGYLRTNEFAQIVSSFSDSKKFNLINWVKQILN